MKAINLLPSDLRGTPKATAPKATAAPQEPGGIGAFVVLGALAACVAALAAYVLTTNTVKDRQAQLEAVTAHAQATTARVNQLKPYADFQAMAETRIQTVKDLSASRFDWEQALRDISRAVPANVTLRELKGTISGGSVGGSGGGVRGAIAAPAIELQGCTVGQKDVATLLARLRNVDGVTRVSLNKSTKPDASTSAASPIAGGAEAIGCPGKRPPNFEIVMFFEGAEVPATVEDVTVQAGASEPSEGGTAASTDSAQPQTESGTTPDPAESSDSAASTPEGGAAQ
jgi:Tfp pilus assembly protein PilN